MSNTARRITTRLLTEAQAEYTHLRMCLQTGSKYENLGFRMIELKRDIASYSAQLAA
jgi:ribosomal protein L29